MSENHNFRSRTAVYVQLWHDLANFLGAELIHTTNYHPKANGFVERFHRSLKASLRAQTNSTIWFSNLSIILLGLRAVHREEMDCSVSEMTLGCALRLPGEFFGENERTQYRSKLTENLKNLKPTLPRDRNSRKIYLDKELDNCTHVFIRVDATKSPLQRSYKGPFKVLRKHDKFFTLDLLTRIDNVSIDRLKAAQLLHSTLIESESSSSEGNNNLASDNFSENLSFPSTSGLFNSFKQKQPAVQLNRYGRRVRLPSRFRDWLFIPFSPCRGGA